MKLNINWKKPKTKLDFLFLAMLLWRDIYKNNYTRKYQSKYWSIVKIMSGDCPLCESKNLFFETFSGCYGLCCLYDTYCDNTTGGDGSYFAKWNNSLYVLEPWEKPSQYSYMIYKRILKEIIEKVTIATGCSNSKAVELINQAKD